MKLRNQTKWLFLLIAAGVFTLSSCLKAGDPIEIQVARVAFLNAVPGSEGVDIGLDQNQVNRPGSGNPNFAYGDTLGYVNAFPGQRLVRVFDPERGSYAPPLTQGTINLTPGEAYTIYVVGDDDLGLVATSDNLNRPETGKAKIRFINLSPDAPSLSFGIRDAESLIASDKEFTKYSDFIEVNAGEALTFDITEHETSNVAHSFSLSLEEGGIYTVWAKGFYDDTLPGTSFGHGLMEYQTPPPATEE